jgi:hypothetical protein
MVSAGSPSIIRDPFVIYIFSVSILIASHSPFLIKFFVSLLFCSCSLRFPVNGRENKGLPVTRRCRKKRQHFKKKRKLLRYGSTCPLAYGVYVEPSIPPCSFPCVLIV